MSADPAPQPESTVHPGDKPKSMVDELARAKNDLVRNQERLELALKASNMGVWEWTIPTDEIYWSEECHKVVGCEPEELTLASFASFMHPEDREYTLRNAKEAAEKGCEYTDSYRLVRKDGSVRWMFNLGRGVLDEQGRPYKLIGTVQDVTERKALEAQFIRIQRLEGLGRLAAGLAHDLNNALVPILSGASILRKSVTDPEDQEILEMIQEAAKHSAAVIKSLVNFGGGCETPLRPASVETVIDSVLALIRPTFPREIEIQHSVQSRLPQVWMEQTMLRQALLNVCINSRDAMPGGGVLELKVDTVDVNLRSAATTPPFVAGRHVRILISDTGCGMDEAKLDQVFDPFNAATPLMGGSGLGLASTLGIVRAHRGFIQVESKPGKGTCFSVMVPGVREAHAG